MKRLTTCLALLVPVIGLVGFAACVGDDPVTGAGTTNDGGGPLGNDGASPVDGAGPGADAAGNDAAMPGDAGGDSAVPLDVRTLPGIRLWLESTKDLSIDVGTGNFGSWRDSSGVWDGGTGGGAPDGGYHVAVPQNVNPPVIVSNGINGRPTLSFTAGNGYVRIDNHADFQFGTGDFLIAEVAKVTSGSGPLWVLRPNATAGSEESFSPGLLCVSYGQGVNNGCTSPEYAPSAVPHVFAARRKGDVFDVRVDGTVQSTLNRIGTVTDIGVNQFIQPYVFIGNGLTMEVSEVIVLVGPTSDSNLAALEGLLKSKYSIP